MKIGLIMLAVIMGVALYAGCKNCGCSTYRAAVYQCKKCRKFFCSNCVEQTKTSKGETYADFFADVADLLKNGNTVRCPICGVEETFLYDIDNDSVRLLKGNFRIIKEKK